MKNLNIKINLNILIGFLLCLNILCVKSVFAASASLSTSNNEIQPNKDFEISLFLNTESDEVNAVEGKISYPTDLFTVKQINDGNSIINFWVDKPKNENGQITFSGIIPGGYNDKKGLIFSIILNANKEGKGIIGINNVNTLLNDGKGTATTTNVSSLSLDITSKAVTDTSIVVVQKDKEIPESFIPTIMTDPTMFLGKFFVIFATQDKGSGIDHYEVCEGSNSCVKAESPYLLTNQNLNDNIFVKAYDKSGNVRTMIIPQPKVVAWYSYIILATILLVVFLIIKKIVWRKTKQ